MAQIRSSLLKNTPDQVPPTEELELLHAELKVMKQKTLERAKKAGEDLKTIEASFRRMKEREKGKAKAVDKIKRERDFTPLPEADDSRLSVPLHGHPSNNRLNSHPTSTLPPSSARSSVDPRRSAAEDLKKKKKKRKREGGESDNDHNSQRPRKATPPVPQVSAHPQPIKSQKATTSSSQPHPKATAGQDFSLPSPQQLLPLRPPIPPPPIPGPSKTTDVMEDFTKIKAPSQTLVTTFYSSIEPWIRNIREEDVGFLEYTGDEVEPFVMPKLGVHYSEVWEEHDANVPHTALPKLKDAPSSSFLAPKATWDPSTLQDTDLLSEERGHGPLTDRVISSLFPIPDVWKGVKAAEDAMEGRPGGSGAAAARRERLNVTDLEARVRDTMRFHGLLGGVPDYSEKVDDPIATALRHAQEELRVVVATNQARKERLTAIARDRLGYQEYIELRDAIDKNITTLFSKLQKKDVPKLSKKKKKPLVGAAAAAAAAAAAGAIDVDAPPPVPPCPAALGLTPDEENRLTVNDQLKQLVETRRQWVDTVGAVFEEKQRLNPGRIWGFPKESIYKGIEEEVREKLLHASMVSSVGTTNGNEGGTGAVAAAPDTAIRINGNGKHKARGDEMDIG
ncbi:hypothetical protein K443DRAFT_685481 [Laccaria amethystina LaAM-08-1]|uniref:Uncharacterized protein n=1 Tax=Laccaria amethystina LaAM-08-1 TaxID=1095629 RepID=A0A0C9WUD2_9AGAR|nr:hypothetical protein K443DRAFT_685481 [Laccaria amethystina LaAM-08-1]